MSNPSSSDSQPVVSGSPQLAPELEALGVRIGTSHLPTAQLLSPRHDPDLGLPGREVETVLGRSYVVEAYYPLEHTHGLYSLGWLLSQDRVSSRLSRLAGLSEDRQLPFRSAAFLDIETSGLGSGAGTYAFLVGLGTFEDERFCLRQFFLRDLQEEGALLLALASVLQDTQWWVSFNGRNFDLPVLNTRYVCSHQELPLANAPHLDLLYPARRLWRRRLSSCALSSLEVGVLGAERQADVSGWEIPELYFDYLRTGDVSPLKGVFLHNARDVISLVTLAARVNSLLQHPLTDRSVHPSDQLSVAIALDTLGETVAAEELLRELTTVASPSAERDAALAILARTYKRQGQRERALPIWQELRAHSHAEAIVELAKYHEHVQRDYATALRLTQEALALDSLTATGELSTGELQGRLARLKSKSAAGGLPVYHIDSYNFGRIVVDGITYNKDLIILPGEVQPAWRRAHSHQLAPEDLADVIAARPATLVIGTGNLGRMQISEDTVRHLESQDVRMEIMRTSDACRRYNELAPAGTVAAALHLTC